MIVGDAKINYGLIHRYIQEPQLLVRMVQDTVPTWCRHREEIVNNQRYMYAVYIRNLLNIPYKLRKDATFALIQNINITGMTTAFIPITEVVDACDKQALLRMLEATRDGQT